MAQTIIRQDATANIHGLDIADPTIYEALKLFARVHRAVPTEAEEVLWQRLRNRQLGFKFRRQHIIGAYIADFVSLEARLVIEVDGLIHQLPGNKESDAHRTGWLNKRGVNVLRFTNEQVLFDTSATIEATCAHLNFLYNET